MYDKSKVVIAINGNNAAHITAYLTIGEAKPLVRYNIERGRAPYGALFNPDGSEHSRIDFAVDRAFPEDRVRDFGRAWGMDDDPEPILDAMMLIVLVTTMVCIHAGKNSDAFVHDMREACGDLPVTFTNMDGTPFVKSGDFATPFTPAEHTKVLEIDVDGSRFVPVMATDFTNCVMRDPGNPQRMLAWDNLRVVHTVSPTWEPEPEGSDRPFAGHWHFDWLALALPSSTGVTFSMIQGGDVHLHSADAITPGGRVCVPEGVYRQFGAADEPTEWLTYEQSRRFDAQNAIAGQSTARH